MTSRAAAVGVGAVAAVAAVALAVTGCTPTAAPVPTPTRTATSTPEAAPQWGDVTAELSALEALHGRRIGVWAFDTGSGATLSIRGDERFGFASTIKLLQAGLLLHDEGVDALGTAVPITADVPVGHAPVTEAAVGGTLTLGELAAAAVSQSDNGAANLLFARAGGPLAVDARLAELLGDDVTELTRPEPDLSRTVPGETADTTTPAQLGADVVQLTAGDILTQPARQQLLAWMRATTTGDATIRAGVPDGWTVGDKTGSGAYGTRNDVGYLEPPGGDPIVLVIMTDALDAGEGAGAPWIDQALADATRVVLAARP